MCSSPYTVLDVGTEINITDLLQTKGFGFGWFILFVAESLLLDILC